MYMSKYIQGKIYKLTSSQTDKVYIGSTIKSLNDRFSNHKYNYKRWLKSQMDKITSYDLLQYEDVKIELIKEFPCETRTELEKEEGKIILYNNCVNRCVAGRTKKEYVEANKEKIKEYYKEYVEANKEKIKERQKEYVEANKEKIKEYYKEYVEANKEKINERRKEYVEANKEKINERRKEYVEANKEKINERSKKKYDCECGGKYIYANKSQHFKTKKHLKFVNQV